MTAATHNPGDLAPWFEDLNPPRERCVLSARLEAVAGEDPGRLFARFEDGSAWSYGDALRLSREWASALHALGVRRGDAVLVWLPNGPAIIRAWFAAAQLGAIFAPINVAYRGDLLEHVIRVSGARILLAHRALIPRLEGLSLGSLEAVITLGGEAEARLPIPVHGPDALTSATPFAGEWPQVLPWDTHAIIYTSGTTGPSKGVLCSGLHFYTVASLAVGFMKPGDTCMVHMPLFHIGAAGAVYGAVMRGAAVAVVDGFSTTRFWDQVRTMGCTTACGLVGSVVPFLSGIAESAGDREQPLQRVLVAPADEQLRLLATRHGFDYFTGYGMSEAPIPLVSELNPDAPGNYCGRPRRGVECRIVDAHDVEVPVGTVGELIVRPQVPWSMNHGYVNDAAATARAWRNGWFHTGDAFLRDAEGRYFFVDRLKDAIRRRGENISSLEVERVVLQHPDVVDAAAVPVPSALGEDEVLVVIQLHEGRGIDPVQLTHFLAARMAHFMVPRYLRIVAEMPRTPTNKVRKPLLREQGVTPDTWDREAAGIVLKRERLS